jgi:3-oxoacyl-[acyl-carrier protein] reductase
MGKLTGKVALVTGASKGIGAGIAKGLAAAGAAVIVNYRSGSADAERVVQTIVAAGGKATAAQADVSKAAEVKRMFEQAVQVLGPVDILVNNGGVYSFGPLEAFTAEEFHRQYDTNVLGPFLTMQEFLRRSGSAGGSIINILTAGISLDSPYSSLYTSTKSALASATRILAKELAVKKIRVNAIAPGATITEGYHALGVAGSEMEAQMIASTPLGRLGLPEDIAPIAVFLASEDAAWVTGDVVFASGGQR